MRSGWRCSRRGRAVGRRRPRRLDVRAAAPASSRPALQRRLDERLERRWLGAADAVVCVAEPAADDLRRRGDRRAAARLQRLGPGGRARAGRRRPACSTPTGSRSSTPGRFGSYGRDPRPLVDGARGCSRATDPDARRQARARDRRAADRGGGASCSRSDVVAGADRPSPAASSATRALALQREADALLLVAQPTRSQLLNIKLFEYLAARHADPRPRRRHRGRARRRRGGRRGRRRRRPGRDRRGARPSR